MQKPIEFQIDAAALSSNPGDIHRIVYAPTFAPYDPFLDDDTIVLSGQQLDRVALFASLFARDEVTAKFTRRYLGLKPQIEQFAKRIAAMEKPVVPQLRQLHTIKNVQRDVIEIGKQLDVAVKVGDTPSRDGNAERMS